MTWKFGVWNYPPRVFEAASGMSGIRGGWRFPYPPIMLHTEKLFHIDEVTGRRYWRALVRINPALPANPEGHGRSWLMGVLSDINLDDLAYWAAGCPDSSHESRVWNAIGVQPYWRVSKPTVRKILAQVQHADQ